ncbi:MAG: site-specific DNA-methyltransferase [Candidatus Methanofastidiosum sp.]|nr:site-specific DNA-methyltransferase [Methanofastidiosum sp.]
MPKKDYDNWSKIELIKEIKKLEKRKKYGIVWEDKPEQVAELCKEKLPVLKEEKTKEIISDDNGFDIIVEGDNYHALSVLNYTHRGMIDVIYIDPPFNTGAKNWKYNNDYVDKEDAFRHSKWLSFMEKRLKLAKPLLKRNGVLICAIDENELWHLGPLLEEIFVGFEIHIVTIVHNPRGVQGKNFSYTNEFAYFVLPKGQKIIGSRKLNEEEIYYSNLRTWGGESTRSTARNCFYPIIIEDDKIVGFGEVPDEDFHPNSQTEERNGQYYVWPIDIKGIERKWRYARQSIESISNLLSIKNNKGRIEIIIGKDFGTIKTVWQDPKYDASEYGTKLVHALVPGNHFDFPKSVYNVYDCLFPIISERKESIILDFFAGSGTTGHAVMMINKAKEGCRKFILCTNNENGIAEDICYPRIKSVIDGNLDYMDITGIKSNIKYFKTDFVDSDPTDENKKKLVDKSTEILCLKEDCFNNIKSDTYYKIFKNSRDKYLGIVFDDEGIEPIKNEIINISKMFVLYVFSLDNSAREEEFQDISNIVEIKPIPIGILNAYKRIFR